MATEAGTTAAGARYTAAIEAIQSAGGADAAAMAAAILAIIAVGGVDLDPADAADIREETEGFIPLTPEGIASADAWVALSVASNVVAVDGTLFRNGTATITASGTIGSPTALTTHRRRIAVTASGGALACAAHGNYRTIGFGAGVTIPQDKIGLFEVWNDGTDDWCLFLALED